MNTDREFLEMMGKVQLPAKPFRIAVTGRDSHGSEYQRFYAGLFHAESAELVPQLDFDELSAGESKQATFLLRNTGAARTFKLTVTDARHFVTSVEPKELSLGADESGKIVVELSVPASTAAYDSDDLVIVAASTAGPATTNSCVVHISVAGNKTAN